jgi:hypothetical protein
MIKTRSISQLVQSQLPAFVRDDYPQFIEFLQAYYEWMEQNGADVYTAKILNSTFNTIVLPNTASTEINAYEGMNIVALNGPAKGHNRTIQSYDPATNTATTVVPWTEGFIPPINTNMVIRDTMYPNKLIDYRDIDLTLDQFLNYFRDEFLFQIPGTILADKRKVLKHVKQFYQARGTENSFRYLFRLLFNEEIEIYYPKVDVFRTDDANWVIQNIMRITTANQTFNWTSRQIQGMTSGATASVESVFQNYINGTLVTDLYLSNIQGVFESGTEPIMISYPYTPPPQSTLGDLQDLLEPSTIVESETTYLILSGLTIQDAGSGYAVNDIINITGGGALEAATAYVSAIFQTFYNGVCQTPPAAFDLQPYWGPNDGTDAENTDPTTDGVAIPGLYFWDDVQFDTSDGPLLTSNQIILASTESNIDNFFDGDQISLVGGTGVGQVNTIIAYGGTTQIATCENAWNPIPDGTTQYSILSNTGGIKAVTITNFGAGYTSTPSVSITSAEGTAGVLVPVLGVVGTTAGRWTVGDYSGVAATTPGSLLDSNKIIQDSYYWQDFSYDIRSGETLSQYSDVVKTLLHPAGMMMFGSVWIKSVPDTSEYTTLAGLLYDIIINAQVYGAQLAVTCQDSLQITSSELGVIGATNYNLDQWKFVAFPPNRSFNLVYSYPNQNYWTASGPGNTQISNFADVVIGDIINNPGTRTKIAPDSYITIQTTDLQTLVGVVGPNFGTLEISKFLGFPPYEGFTTVWPAPNENYWNGPGNTQIKDFQNIVIDKVINNPTQNRFNFCVDSDIEMMSDDDGIPAIGNIVEYAFLEGNDSQLIYNVSPNEYFGLMDAVLGNNETVETVDPAFDSYGIVFNAVDSQFVNATGVPVLLQQMSVTIVVQCEDTTASQNLISSIQFDTDNGYSIDLIAGGGLLFRAQYGGVTCEVSYPTATVTENNWFMATLIFENGLLTAQVNQEATVRSQFSSYPLNPTSNSLGWYLGKGSVSYITQVLNASLFRQILFNTDDFSQASSGSTTTTFGSFDGRYAFAIFYDRALYNFEVTSIYKYLQSELNSTRGITLP